MFRAPGGPLSKRTFGFLSGGAPFFVLGWREVFVPLAVVMHNQHGPSLAVAGLAIAASRLGAWLHARQLFRRSPYEAAVLGGLALLLLGLAPEEGPVGLLLWFVFGVTWPLLHEALAERLWTGWTAALVLLVGMAVAGPLANGPGTWLIAGWTFILAWRLHTAPKAGDWQEAAASTGPASPARTAHSAAVPFLFGCVSLMWIWLVPARLADLGVALGWFGAMLAGSWLARFAGAWLSTRLPGAARRGLSALGLAAGIGLVAWAPAAGLLIAGLALFGAALGMAGSHPAIERPELGRLPGRAQALGEVLGPLVGVAIYLLGGSPVLFIAAALTSLALPLAHLLPPPPNPISN